MIAGPKVEFVFDVCRQMAVSIENWLDIGCGGSSMRLAYLIP